MKRGCRKRADEQERETSARKDEKERDARAKMTTLQLKNKFQEAGRARQRVLVASRLLNEWERREQKRCKTFENGGLRTPDHRFPRRDANRLRCAVVALLAVETRF